MKKEKVVLLMSEKFVGKGTHRVSVGTGRGHYFIDKKMDWMRPATEEERLGLVEEVGGEEKYAELLCDKETGIRFTCVCLEPNTPAKLMVVARSSIRRVTFESYGMWSGKDPTITREVEGKIFYRSRIDQIDMEEIKTIKDTADFVYDRSGYRNSKAGDAYKTPMLESKREVYEYMLKLARNNVKTHEMMLKRELDRIDLIEKEIVKENESSNLTE